MPPAPRVSVCIPTHNRCHLLEQAVESVLAQSFQDFELIISDNASSDETLRTCEGFLRDPRVRYHRNAANIGSWGNVRKLIHEYARGEFLALLPDDDRYADRDALATLSAILADDGTVAFASGGVHVINKITNMPDKITRQPAVLLSKTFIKGYLLNEFPGDMKVPAIFPSATLIRTGDARRIRAGLTPGVHYSGDFEMYASLALLRGKVVFLRETLSEVSWSQTSESYSYGGESLDAILQDHLAAYAAIFGRLRDPGLSAVRFMNSELNKLERLALDRVYKRDLAAILLRKEAGNCSSRDILRHFIRILWNRPTTINVTGLAKCLLATMMPRTGLRILRKLCDGMRR